MPSQQKSPKNKAIDISSLANKIAERANYIAAREFYNKVIHFREVAVSAFYRSYRPKYYDRTYSLRYMIYPNIINNMFSFEIGPDVPIYTGWHRVNADYIYENTFKQGYHGGAINGPEHPRPGVPTWRWPYPEYTRWGRKALKGPSIYNIFMELWNNYITGDQLATLFQKAIQEAINKYQNEINNLVIAHMSNK